MQKLTLILIIIFLSNAGFSQTTYNIQSDSVRLANDSTNTELNIENGTRNVCGFLFNKGNGRTEFRKVLNPIGTNKYLIGCDTLDLSGIMNTNRFGIEDNLGLQNRIIDMQSNTISFNNLGAAYFNGHVFANGGFTVANASLEIDNGTLFLTNGTFGVDLFEGYKSANRSIQIPDKDGYLAMTVNGSSADNTGNITISTGGGLTNVATGYGLSGGPITTTGTITVDSAALHLKFLGLADSTIFYPYKSNPKNYITSANGWGTTGNTGTVGGTNFIGTTDNVPINFRVNNALVGTIGTTANYNVSLGALSLPATSTGIKNMALGGGALNHNTTGQGNNAIGYTALYNNTTGNYNTANGWASLGYNQTGSGNTAMGAGSMNVTNGAQTTGSYNTALGFNALTDLFTGNYNIGLGAYGGYQKTGRFNTLFISDSTYHMYYKLDSASGIAPNVIGKDVSGFWHVYSTPSAGGGAGSVTSFSSGNLSALFSTSVATATTTPALSFTLNNAAAHTFFGNNTASTATPGYVSITLGDLPDLSGIYQPVLNGTGFVRSTGTSIIYDNSTYLTGNQTISFAPTGDVTGSTTGTTTIAPALVIGANKVLNPLLAQMPTLTIKGNNTGGIANAADLTVAQVNAILPVFNSTLQGLTPLSGGGTSNYLRADGTWAVPPGNSSGWGLTGNAGTTSANFIGTTDNQDLRFKAGTGIYPQVGFLSAWLSGTYNTMLGGGVNLGGTYNTFIGAGAGGTVGGGTSNVFIGYGAGTNQPTSTGNIAIGNTAIGNTSGKHNIGIGTATGLANTGGNYNIYLGYGADPYVTGYTSTSHNFFISDSTSHMKYKLDSAAGAPPSVIGKDATGFWHVYQTPSGGSGGAGSVTSFSSGNISSLFSTSVATATTTPALSFTLNNAAAHTFFGNNTASTGTPGYVSITLGDLPDLSGIYQPAFNGTGFVKVAGTTISYDNSTYLTANQPVTVTATGDATGISSNSTTAPLLPITLATVNSDIGTFNSITINAKGLATAGSNVSYLTSNQTISFAPTGDITGSTTGTTTIAPALVIGTNKVLNSMLAQMPALTIKGNNTGGISNAADLTIAQVNAILPVFNSTLNGLVPLSGGSARKVLHADGVWRDTTAIPTQGITSVQEDGTVLTSRPTLNFNYGVKGTDNSGSSRTDVDVNLTTGESFLASDVAMTAAATFFDGGSVSLTAGTWMIMSTGTIESTNNNAMRITGKIWNGTTVFAASEGSSAAMGASAKGYVNMSMSSIITLAATTTIKASYTSTLASCVLKATPADNSTGTTGKASSIRAIRIK